MPILNPFKNIIFRSVFIFFISSIIYAQNVIVQGVVRNPAEKPVKKANGGIIKKFSDIAKPQKFKGIF